MRFQGKKILIFVVIITLVVGGVLILFTNRKYFKQLQPFSFLLKDNPTLIGKPNDNLEKPNVVFINIDSLRADHMSFYGYPKKTTPFLDDFFRRGVVFENAVAAAPFTFQDDVSIFSGLFPSQNNILDWQSVVDKNLTLLPKIFSFYGYKTMAFASPSLWESFGINKSFDQYQLDLALKNIEERKTAVAEALKSAQKPFFAFWHIYDVHLPYYAASEDFFPQKYRGALNPISDYFVINNASSSAPGNKQIPGSSFVWSSQDRQGLCDSAAPPQGNSTCPKYVALNSTDREYIRAAYDTGIKFTDKQLADFFDLIKNEPFFKNTIFIISAEHGEDLGEHGLFFHGDIYNVNTHIPLAIIFPKIPAKNIAERVSSLDILPTILSLANIPFPANIEGEDLSRLIENNEYDNQRPIFSERAPFNEYSVIAGDWKYILRDSSKVAGKGNNLSNFMKMVLASDDIGNKKDELYNLSNDPYEQHNLVGKGYNEEAELKKLVQDFSDRMAIARKKNTAGKDFPPVIPQKIIPYP